MDHEGAYVFVSGDFITKVVYTPGLNEIDIRYKDLTYNYNKPEKNHECLERFLEFYEDQCKIENIKLRKPKQVKNK